MSLLIWHRSKGTIIHYSKKFKWIFEIGCSLCTARELVGFLVVIFFKATSECIHPYMTALGPKMWPLLGGTWNLSLATTNRVLCVALCGHSWRGLSSLRLHLLLSWRVETHPASFSLYHPLLPVKLSALHGQGLHSHSLPQLKDAKVWRTEINNVPIFSPIFCISLWKYCEAKLFGNILWCFHTKIRHK